MNIACIRRNSSLNSAFELELPSTSIDLKVLKSQYIMRIFGYLKKRVLRSHSHSETFTEFWIFEKLINKRSIFELKGISWIAEKVFY